MDREVPHQRERLTADARDLDHDDLGVERPAESAGRDRGRGDPGRCDEGRDTPAVGASDRRDHALDERFPHDRVQTIQRDQPSELRIHESARA